jgi:hypothetical protein
MAKGIASALGTAPFDSFKKGLDSVSEGLGATTKQALGLKDVVEAIKTGHKTAQSVNGFINDFQNPTDESGKLKNGVGAALGKSWDDYKGYQAAVSEAIKATDAHTAGLAKQRAAQLAANGAAQLGKGIFNALGGWVGVTVTALTALAVLAPKAWQAMKSEASKAKDAVNEALKPLEEQIELLERRNGLLSEGNTIGTKSDDEVTKYSKLKEDLTATSKRLKEIKEAQTPEQQIMIASLKRNLDSGNGEDYMRLRSYAGEQIDLEEKCVELRKGIAKIDEDTKKVEVLQKSANTKIRISNIESELDALDLKAKATAEILSALGNVDPNSEELANALGSWLDNYKNATAAAKNRADEQARFINGLREEIDVMGLSDEALKRHQAEVLGLTKSHKKAAEVERLIADWSSKKKVTEATENAKTLGNELDAKATEIDSAKLVASEQYLIAKQKEIDALKAGIDLLEDNAGAVKKLEESQKSLNSVVATMRAEEATARLREWAPEMFEAADEAKKLAQAMVDINVLTATLPSIMREAVAEFLKAKAEKALSPDAGKAERAVNALREAGILPLEIQNKLREKSVKQANEEVVALKSIYGLNDEVIAQLQEQLALRSDPDWQAGQQIKKQYDPMIEYEERAKKLKELEDKELISNSERKKAMGDLNRETMQKLAEMGNGWAIFGTVIQNSSQKFTDAIVGWINDVDNVGRSWVTLRETVKGVLRDIATEIQKMLIQKTIMDPLFDSAGGLFKGLVGIGKGEGGGKKKDPEKQVNPSIPPNPLIPQNPINPADPTNPLGLASGIADGAGKLGDEALMTATRQLAVDTGLADLAVQALGEAAGQAAFTIFELDMFADYAATSVMELGTAAAAAVAEIATAKGVKTVIPVVSADASGGSVLSGSTYLVGERGPELFVSKTAGVIVPNNRLGGGGGAGGATVTIVQNISPGRTDTRTSAPGGGAAPWAGMAKAVEGVVLETIRKEQRQGNSLNPVFPNRRG